ncbi:MAG: hypothetical protein JSW61_13615 [Candidatus Thorarchaeota archaeon]|nr:MAG: hypothetical protein JSW61_13615 [Candidatus Thorarchaeota archaeon]
MHRTTFVSRTGTILIVAMLLLSSFQYEVAAQREEMDTVVVLYDTTHRQQFDARDPDYDLKLMLDVVNASTKYIVKLNEEDPLNDTILSDVDILIIADPDNSSVFRQEELESIVEFLANGSSLLALGDPTISQNSTYWVADQTFQDLGENYALNNFFDGINMTGVRFSVNHTTSAGLPTQRADTMFDYEHALNETVPWVIELDSSTWDTTHPIFKDINSLITMTATLKPIDDASIVARSHETTFAQYRRGPNTWANLSYPNMSLDAFNEVPLSYSAINGTFPPWLAAFQYDTSRVIVAGSTLMFTARTLDLPLEDDRTDLRWFYQADNSRLFMNMLNWLSEGSTEPPGAIVPMAIISSAILVVGVAFYIFKRIKR